jgi:CHAD domain-containing protein
MGLSALSTHIERERKFDSGPGTPLPDLPDLQDLPGVGSVRSAAAEQLDAVYYDTADHLLQRHRITLRRRTGGHDEGWHLKLPEGQDARREIRLPLDAGPPGRVPEELELRVRARAHGRPLVPVARLHTRRRRLLLADVHDHLLAEIAEDTVTARVLNGAGKGGTAGQQKWSEVEAELAEGDGDAGDALLDALEQRFLQAGLHRSATASKLARALGGSGAAPAADGTASAADAPRPGSLGELLTAQLRAQVETVLTLDVSVRRDRPDAVHGMRVAVRRLRSTLRSFRRFLDRPTADALVEDLRRLGADLGAARDSEVVAGLLDGQARLLPKLERPGPLRRRIVAWSAEQDALGREQVLTTLESTEYFGLLAALEQLAAHPGLRARADRPARPELRRILVREQRRVGERIAGAQRLPRGPEHDLALHDARKAAKRARYAAESAEPVAGARAGTLALRMKALQTLLGDHHDAMLARAALPGLAAAAHAAGEPGFGYGVLYAGQSATFERTEAELPQLWAAAGRRKLTRKL